MNEAIINLTESVYGIFIIGCGILFLVWFLANIRALSRLIVRGLLGWLIEFDRSEPGDQTDNKPAFSLDDPKSW